jgi:hypothetical protein
MNTIRHAVARISRRTFVKLEVRQGVVYVVGRVAK